MARLDEKDNVVEQYVYATRVNVPDYMVKDGRKYRLLTDHRGSVRLVVDSHTGAVMQRTDYDELGNIIAEELATSWEPVIFGYAGGLQDRHTGLIRFGARDYDPETGRWTSKEPLGFNGSSNFYAYADNDPVNFVDVTGLYVGIDDAVFSVGGFITGIATQAISDIISRDMSGWEDYVGSGIGGAAMGEALLYTGPFFAGAIGGASSNVAKQFLKMGSGKQECFDATGLAIDTLIGGSIGKLPGAKISGINKGRGSMSFLYKKMTTQMKNGQISNISIKTAGKMFVGTTDGLLPSIEAGGFAGNTVSDIRDLYGF